MGHTFHTFPCKGVSLASESGMIISVAGVAAPYPLMASWALVDGKKLKTKPICKRIKTTKQHSM